VQSLRRLLLFRFGFALALVLAMAALMQIILPDWVDILVSLILLVAITLAVSWWTQRTLAADLREVREAVGKVVVEGELEAMPQPHLSDLQGLALDLEAIGVRVKEQYGLLREEKEKLQTILDNINAGIIVLDVAGKVELINPAAERILGAGRSFAQGRSLVEIHPSSAIDRAVEDSRQGEEGEAEVIISTPRKSFLRVRTSPIRVAAGEIGGVICVLEDLTATRGVERMRRDFVANVSHELRTPVANLRVLVEALQAGALQDADKARHFLGDLDAESARLVGLVEDLLTLSRLEAAEFAPQRGYFSLDELIAQVLDEKRLTAERYQVELVFKHPGKGPIIYGDRSLIRTACANLLDNAVKYNRPGGRVEIVLSADDDDVRLTFTDNGIGIPAGDQERVFERFYRVDQARSRETGGTGLGLSIVRHVAELHEGSVKMTSIEGAGSTFTLSLSLRSD
jgi:two-component system phosphate regulon sensor histidine kinase PhoR